MSNLPEPLSNERENWSKAGQKLHSAAVRTGVIGSLVSFFFALLAIAIVMAERTDSAGFPLFVLSLLAIVVFVISGCIVILISLAGVLNYATMLYRYKDSREESINGISKNVGLVLGTVLVLLGAVKLFKNIL